MLLPAVCLASNLVLLKNINKLLIILISKKFIQADTHMQTAPNRTSSGAVRFCSDMQDHKPKRSFVRPRRHLAGFVLHRTPLVSLRGSS